MPSVNKGLARFLVCDRTDLELLEESEEMERDVRRAALNLENLEKSFAFIIGLLKDVGANTPDVDALISESQGRNDILEGLIETYLTSEPASSVVNLGFPRDRVENAIRAKVKQTGLGFSNSNDLIDAILNALQKETTSLNVVYKLY